MTLTAESRFADTDECADPNLNTCPKKKGIACVNEISGRKDSYHCACAPGYKSDSNNAEGHDITCKGKLIHVMFSCLWENNL